jgi:hypothetical protein
MKRVYFGSFRSRDVALNCAIELRRSIGAPVTDPSTTGGLNG